MYRVFYVVTNIKHIVHDVCSGNFEPKKFTRVKVFVLNCLEVEQTHPVWQRCYETISLLLELNQSFAQLVVFHDDLIKKSYRHSEIRGAEVSGQNFRQFVTVLN